MKQAAQAAIEDEGPALQVDVQIAVDDEDVPDCLQIQQYLSLVLDSLKPMDHNSPQCLTVRIVSVREISQLNEQFRHQQGPTNVLSFPFELPPGIGSAQANPVTLLGDIVVCASIVRAEAQAQGKPLQHHWAHILTHGLLHLLGFDHVTDPEAEIMEGLEIKALAKLAIPNPYLEGAAIL